MRSLAAALLILTSITITAQQQTAVQVVVVDSSTNMPVSGSSLELRAVQQNPEASSVAPNNPIPYFTATSSPVFPGLTADGGQFVFRNIPPGRYTLTASRNGFVHAEYGQRGPNSKGMILTIAPGQATTNVRLTMTRSGAISGHVFDNSGAPLAYVQVQMRRVTYPNGQRTLTLTSSTVTDDLGAYRLYGFPKGAYVLSAETNTNSVGIQPVLSSRTPPVPGVVVFQSASGPMLTDTDPANQNRRKDSGLLLYYPNVSDPRLAKVIDLRPGDDLSGIDLTLNAVRSPPISVTWAISGNTSPSAGLIDLVVSSISYGGDVRNRLGLPPGVTGPIISSLPPGSYLALAMERGYGPGNGTALLSVGYLAFDTGTSPAFRADIRMTPTREITGRVIGEGPLSSLSEADMTKLRINLRRDPPLPLLSVPSSVTAAKDGSFALKGFPDGNWVVTVTGLPDSFRNAYVKSLRALNAEISGNRVGIPLQPAGPIELQVMIAANGGQLSGSAISETGTALSNVTVLLAPDSMDRPDLYRTTATDSAGHYHFEALAPGTYQIYSWEDIEADAWFNPEFMSSVQGQGKTIQVVEGSSKSMDVTAIPIQ